MAFPASQELASPIDGPLSAEHFREVSRAEERAKLIRKAARVASFNGWTTAVIAALSSPFALFDLTNLLVTLVLSVVAWNEFRGRNRLNQFDPSAATLLCWNQLGFLAMIICYCGWMIVAGINETDSFAAELNSNPELRGLIGSTAQVSSLYAVLVYVVYGTVIFLSIIFQGLTAYYYFTRRKYVEAYVQATPEWVRKLQRG